MIENTVFARHCHESAIRMLCDYECALISSACAQAVAHGEPGERVKIIARHEEEKHRAEAWRDYLIACAHRRFPDGMPHDPSRPQTKCMPRSRAHWISSLRCDIQLIKNDFLRDLLVGFVVGFMLAQLTGEKHDFESERAAFLSELRGQLREADEAAAKEESAGVKKSSLKPRKG